MTERWIAIVSDHSGRNKKKIKVQVKRGGTKGADPGLETHRKKGRLYGKGHKKSASRAENRGGRNMGME